MWGAQGRAEPIWTPWTTHALLSASHHVQAEATQLIAGMENQRASKGGRLHYRQHSGLNFLPELSNRTVAQVFNVYWWYCMYRCLSAHMSVYHVHAWCPQQSGVETLTGVTGEHPCGCWESNQALGKSSAFTHGAASPALERFLADVCPSPPLPATTSGSGPGRGWPLPSCAYCASA